MRKTSPDNAWPAPGYSPPDGGGHSALTVVGIGIALALGGGVFGLLIASELGTMTLLALGVCIVPITLRYPIAALALAGATDVTCYYISGLTLYPPRTYLITLVAFASIPKIWRLVCNNTLARKIAIIFLIFTIISVAADWAGGLNQAALLKLILARKVTPALIFLCCAAHARKRTDFQIILGTMLVATTVSGIFGILQYHDIGIGWEFRNALQAYIKAPVSGYIITEMDLGRPMGLAGGTIDFSYHILMAYAVATPLLFMGNFPNRTRLLLMAISGTLLIAIIESLTRSAILGAAFVTLFAVLPRKSEGNITSKNHLRNFVLVGFILATTFMTLRSLEGSATDQRIYNYEDNTRTSLYISSIRMIGWYPLGVGNGNIQKTAAKHSADFLDLPTPTALLEIAPHNGFILVTIYWGLPMLALMIYLFFLLFRFGRELVHLSPFLPPGHRWWGKMVPIWLGAYIIHCSFHNSFPFTGDMVFWYYIGIICAVPNMAYGGAETQPWLGTQKQSAVDPSSRSNYPSPVH